jgi:type II pantothenate kinase
MAEGDRMELLMVRYETGHAATIATLSYAIRFWSKGTKRALFLRHEGFLYVFLFATISARVLTWIRRGSIGAWIRNITEEESGN